MKARLTKKRILDYYVAEFGEPCCSDCASDIVREVRGVLADKPDATEMLCWWNWGSGLGSSDPRSTRRMRAWIRGLRKLSEPEDLKR